MSEGRKGGRKERKKRNGPLILISSFTWPWISRHVGIVLVTAVVARDTKQIKEMEEERTGEREMERRKELK